MRDENQLHAAVVELIALEGAQINTRRSRLVSRRQEWQGRDLQLRHQARRLPRRQLEDFWTQVETGSAITWKYPSVILQGDNAVGEFYSVALTNHYQQADTGTKMITSARTHEARFSPRASRPAMGTTLPWQVRWPRLPVTRALQPVRLLLLGDKCAAHTFPYIEVKNATARVEHEASTSRIGEDQLYYCQSRGIAGEDAVSMIVNGFCKDVFKQLPMDLPWRRRSCWG